MVFQKHPEIIDETVNSIDITTVNVKHERTGIYLMLARLCGIVRSHISNSVSFR